MANDYEEARRAREAKLRLLQDIVRACTCLWPVVRMRNRHGHADYCAAGKLEPEAD